MGLMSAPNDPEAVDRGLMWCRKALSGQGPGTKGMIDPDGVRRDDLEEKKIM